MVRTLDFESNNPSSNLGETYFYELNVYAIYDLIIILFSSNIDLSKTSKVL